MIDSLALLVIDLGLCMGGNLTILFHHTITTAMECHQHEMAALLRYFGFPFGKVGRSVSISISVTGMGRCQQNAKIITFI